MFSERKQLFPPHFWKRRANELNYVFHFWSLAGLVWGKKNAKIFLKQLLKAAQNVTGDVLLDAKASKRHSRRIEFSGKDAN